MRTDYVAGGVVLSVLGLVLLMASGGLTFWASGSSSGGDSGSAAATIGIPPVIGWAMLVIGVMLLVLGLLDYGVAQRTQGSTRRDRDITVIK